MGNNVTEVFRQYKRQLLCFVKDRISSDDDAEDILQDVFLRFLLAEGEISIVEISGWLYRAARNRIIDYYRKRHEERLPECNDLDWDSAFISQFSRILNDEDQSPEKVCVRNFVWEELELALDELPEEQRFVFEQTELYGMTFRQLSDDLCVPVNTLLSRKYYAMTFLRKRLKEVYEELLSDD